MGLQTFAMSTGTEMDRLSKYMRKMESRRLCSLRLCFAHADSTECDALVWCCRSHTCTTSCNEVPAHLCGSGLGSQLCVSALSMPILAHSFASSMPLSPVLRVFWHVCAQAWRNLQCSVLAMLLCAVPVPLAPSSAFSG